MKKSAAIIILIALLIGLGVGITLIRNNRSKSTNGQVAGIEKVKVQDISYQGRSGETVLALLKEKYQIKEKKYSFGVMVEGINGINGDKDHFWALYVNGTKAEAGADSFLTEDGDIVTWKYEEIK